MVDFEITGFIVVYDNQKPPICTMSSRSQAVDSKFESETWFNKVRQSKSSYKYA